MSSTSKMTEALEDHLSCVFAARRSRLEEVAVFQFVFLYNNNNLARTSFKKHVYSKN